MPTTSPPSTSHPVFARFYERISVVMDRAGGAEHRRDLVAALTGRVIEIGAGNGRMFAHYPPGVAEVVAIEPEPRLREAALAAAATAPVVDGMAEALPAGDGEFDAAVAALVLCTVPDQTVALAEVVRVLRPGGQLRFFEHVAADTPGGLRRMQRIVDATVWPRLFAGCHTGRDTVSAITTAGFTLDELHRFRFPPTGPSSPAATRPRRRHPARRPSGSPVSGAGGQVPVTVYSRPGCRLRHGLRIRNVTFTEVNIWTDPEAATAVRAAADGNETVPTVHVAGQWLVTPAPPPSPTSPAADTSRLPGHGHLVAGLAGDAMSGAAVE